jgi:hypothetical protein
MKTIPGITLLWVLMLVICGAAEGQGTHKVWVDDNQAQTKTLPTHYGPKSEAPLVTPLPMKPTRRKST